MVHEREDSEDLPEPLWPCAIPREGESTGVNKNADEQGNLVWSSDDRDGTEGRGK